MLEMKLLGGCDLRVGANTVRVSRKSRALLSFLATNPSISVSRDRLADLLWTRSGPEQARHSLRQTLVEIRRETEGIDLISSNGDGLALVSGSYSTDLDQLRDAAASDDPAGWRLAGDAYAGPFLEGFPPVSPEFDDWLPGEREAWRERALEVMARLADSLLADGDARACVTQCERMLAIDPLREDNHRRLIQAYASAGRRADAVRQYQACAEVLRRQLDVAPSAETEELYRRVRTGNAFSANNALPETFRGGLPDVRRPPGMSEPAPIPLDARPSIAVLPFRRYQSAPEDAYFADGIVDDIIHALGGLSDLFVISRGSTLGFGSGGVDTRAIGQQLGVRYVLYGSAQRAGDRLRIGTELSETESGTVIHSERFDGFMSELFDLQDRISLNVVKMIAPHVQERELRRAMRKHPQSMTAFDLTLQALDLLYRMDSTSFLRARGLLEQAIHADPDYAPPYAYCAYWHVFRVGEFGHQAETGDAEAGARFAAEAVKRDGRNALALAMSGHVQSFFMKNYPSALAFLDRAISAGPNLPIAWAMSSATHGYLGHGDVAVSHAEKAVRLSPLDALLFWHEGLLAQAHYVNGDYDQALKWSRMAVARNESIRFNLRTLIAILAALGEVEEAGAVGRHLMALQPDFRIGAYAARTPFQGEQLERRVAHLRLAGLPD